MNSNIIDLNNQALFQLIHFALVMPYSVIDFCQHWFQLMACLLMGVKPLSEPLQTYCEWDSQEQISIKFQSEYNDCYLRKFICKFCLQNVNDFVDAPMC